MTGSVFSKDRTQSHVWVTPTSGPRLLVLWEGGSVTRPLEPGARLVVGRGDECDVQVLHSSISRRHVELISGPPLVVRDLGSTNGARVRGVAMSANAEMPIALGEPVEFGAAVLIVQPGPDQKAQPAPTGPGAMDRVRHLTHLVAPTQMPVLLLGETGVGKEVTASAIHAASTRRAGPFVRVNCAALTESLLESELFGHERGAFTGAQAAKEGLLEAADGGTMFLDEVGDLPLTLQAKLLRVLEDGEVRRVGATRGRVVSVRFISATNRDLPLEVQSGAFRADLYFRLNGMTIRIPPLRARGEDLADLCVSLLSAAYARIGAPVLPLSADTLGHLQRYAWPGNVRELRNVLERAVVLSNGRPITPEHLLFEEPIAAPGVASASPPTQSSRPEDLPQQLERIERTRVEQALAQTQGNQTLAARILGITRRQLIARIEAYKLPRPRKKNEP